MALAVALTAAATPSEAQDPLPADYYGAGLNWGDVVTAWIGDAECGTSTVDDSGGWQMSINAGDCGGAAEDGATIRFTVTPRPFGGPRWTAQQTAPWSAGSVPDDVANGITLTGSPGALYWGCRDANTGQRFEECGAEFERRADARYAAADHSHGAAADHSHDYAAADHSHGAAAPSPTSPAPESTPEAHATATPTATAAPILHRYRCGFNTYRGYSEHSIEAASGEAAIDKLDVHVRAARSTNERFVYDATIYCIGPDGRRYAPATATDASPTPTPTAAPTTRTYDCSWHLSFTGRSGRPDISSGGPVEAESAADAEAIAEASLYADPDVERVLIFRCA